MPEQRRRFSAQFKAEAVQMVLESKRPIADVAHDLGIHDGTLKARTAQWRPRDHPGQASEVDVLLPGCRVLLVLVLTVILTCGSYWVRPMSWACHV